MGNQEEPTRKRAPGYLRENYKKSTQIRRLDTPAEKVVSHEREHWDGSQDARVAPKPFQTKFGKMGEAMGLSAKETRELRNEVLSQRARQAKEHLRNRER